MQVPWETHACCFLFGVGTWGSAEPFGVAPGRGDGEGGILSAEEHKAEAERIKKVMTKRWDLGDGNDELELVSVVSDLSESAE